MDVSSENFVGKFLLAIPNAHFRASLGEYIVSHFPGFKIYEAKDGVEATGKLENDPPDIFIIDESISRRSYEQIILSIYANPKTRGIQTILLGEKTISVDLEDFVARNDLQVVSNKMSMEAIPTCLYKAVNHLNRKDTKFRMRFLRKGEVLIQQGEKGNCIYILHRGKLTAYLGEAPTENPLGHIVPGEFVGEMSYINNEPRVASVIAEEDSQLVEFSPATFDRVIYQKPSWMKALLSTLSKRIKVLNKRASPTQT